MSRDHFEPDLFERVIEIEDIYQGIGATIAVHNTLLGPAMGGTRMKFYGSMEARTADAKRLAKAMTYKSAVAGNNLGGGKATIDVEPGDLHPHEREELLRRYALWIDTLDGLYYTAEDVGTTQADMDLIHSVTPYVVGKSNGVGDPSPATGFGVFYGIAVAVEEVYDGTAILLEHINGSSFETDWQREAGKILRGKRVAVQGLGKVGSALATLLIDSGAIVIGSDPFRNPASIDGVIPSPVEDFHTEIVDVFAPCAVGGILNETTISELRCSIVAGSSNNQLASPDIAAQLEAERIVYVPDFIINAGGIIHVASEIGREGIHEGRTLRDHIVTTVSNNVGLVLENSQIKKISTVQAAEAIAETRINAALASSRAS